MDVGLYWQPIDRRYLKGDVSEVKSVLKEVFGKFPLSLNLTDLEALQDIVRTADSSEVWNQLIEGLLQHGMITVSVEYSV
jgi:hypothetical protein